MKDTGYVSEDHVIAAARSVGFELGGRSEINANPRDTRTSGKAACGNCRHPLRGDEADREAQAWPSARATA
jgi:predicted methyltransferase